MKKKILLSVLAIAICFAAASLLSKPKDSTKDDDLKKFLSEAGFKNVPSLKSYSVDNEKKYWMDKYGVYFISFQEMDTLCKANGFIVGPSDRFLQEIPIEATIQMKDNYKKIDRDILRFGFGDRIGWNPKHLWFSSSEVGWVVRNSDDDRSYEYHFVRENLKHRLTKKGVKVLNEVYHTYSYPEWSVSRSDEFEKVFVVADPRKFNTEGMQIVGIELQPIPKPDPIAVIRHRLGYVILSKW